MTSPIPPRVSEQETAEVVALSPSKKIFIAASIIAVGAAISAVFWKASLDSGFLDSLVNPTIDKQIVTAPLPNLTAQSSNPNLAASLPSLSKLPSIDEGSGKYTQMYPPPPIIETAIATKAAEKPAFPEKAVQTVVEKPALPDNTTFTPIYKAPVAPPPEKEGDLGKLQKQQPVAPETGTNSKMLSIFQFADNYEPNRKAEQGLPDDPFLTTPSSVLEERTDINSDLVPLRFSDISELVPLKIAPNP